MQQQQMQYAFSSRVIDYVWFYALVLSELTARYYAYCPPHDYRLYARLRPP
ncbi:hypothetical protein L249_0139 [Ophiocordyceps polyrhachis-furcata BCC 54312]|uniref:Uncharacterized protein n=1 Tax=Ophiocordyceps polyrhachis-furcata BCC 54312 TaxID=1330021 RepID=A0A367LCB3_9HYPO|nr:hypothetical protein L249_0139 [Ophiocordyceps polyrhachis-furcata BCC 54312]